MDGRVCDRVNPPTDDPFWGKTPNKFSSLCSNSKLTTMTYAPAMGWSWPRRETVAVITLSVLRGMSLGFFGSPNLREAYWSQAKTSIIPWNFSS